MKFNYHSEIAMQRITGEIYGENPPLHFLCHAKRKGKETSTMTHYRLLGSDACPDNRTHGLTRGILEVHIYSQGGRVIGRGE